MSFRVISFFIEEIVVDCSRDIKSNDPNHFDDYTNMYIQVHVCMRDSALVHFSMVIHAVKLDKLDTLPRLPLLQHICINELGHHY